MAGHVRRSLTGRSALERPISLGLLAGFACLAFFLLGAVFYGSGSGGGCAGGCLPTGSNAEVAALISQLAARSSGLSSANAAALNGELPAAAARAVAGMATGASPAAPPVRRRRRIVLDVGANSGNSYVELKNNWVGRTIHGNMSDYEVFLMEPNPIFRPYITKLMAAEHAAAGKTFISYLPVAGGTTNGILPFHIDPSMPIAGKFTEEDGYGSGGSSLIAKMPAVDPSNPANPNLRSGVATAGAPAKVVEVESIDLAEWLAREVAIEDEFHLKIDVEGFEYALMQRLLPRGLLCLPDHLYMELHSRMLDQSTDTSLHGLGKHESTIFGPSRDAKKRSTFTHYSDGSLLNKTQTNAACPATHDIVISTGSHEVE